MKSFRLNNSSGKGLKWFFNASERRASIWTHKGRSNLLKLRIALSKKSIPIFGPML